MPQRDHGIYSTCESATLTRGRVLPALLYPVPNGLLFRASHIGPSPNLWHPRPWHCHDLRMPDEVLVLRTERMHHGDFSFERLRVAFMFTFPAHGLNH